MRLLRLLKRDLGREIETWVDDGLISNDQAAQISVRYGIKLHSENTSAFGFSMLVVLGFLFCGIAAIIFIGANWENIPRAARTVTLLSTTAAANFAALIYFRRGNDSLAIGLFLLGSILYGACIMLIAQIYHLGEHFPDGIFWWALGVLPVALATGSAALMTLVTVLSLVWIWVEAGMGYFPALYPVFIAGLAVHLLRHKQSLTLFLFLVFGAGLYLQLAMGMLMSNGYGLQPGAENVVLGAGYMLLLFAASRWLLAQSSAKAQDYGTVLDVWLLRFAILTLFVFSFAEPWRELIRADWEHPAAIQMIATLHTVLALAIWWFARAKNKSFVTPISAALYLALTWFVTSAQADANVTTLQVITNVSIIVFGIYLLVHGISQSITHYFYAGLFTILGLAVVRYFDLVGDYVSTSFLFLICALILLATAYFWRKRQNADQQVSIS